MGSNTSMILLALTPLILISAIALIAVSMKEHPSFEGGMVDSDICHCRSCSTARVQSRELVRVSQQASEAEIEGSLVAA